MKEEERDRERETAENAIGMCNVHIINVDVVHLPIATVHIQSAMFESHATILNSSGEPERVSSCSTALTNSGVCFVARFFG